MRVNGCVKATARLADPGLGTRWSVCTDRQAVLWDVAVIKYTGSTRIPSPGDPYPPPRDHTVVCDNIQIVLWCPVLSQFRTNLMDVGPELIQYWINLWYTPDNEHTMQW